MRGFDRTLAVLPDHRHLQVQHICNVKLAKTAEEIVNFGGYFGPHNPNTFAAAPALLDACKSMIPSNISLGNANIPDDMIVPLETTMGDLRKIAAAIAQATAVVS